MKLNNAKHTLEHNDAQKLAYMAGVVGELELIFAKTPFDDLLEKEDADEETAHLVKEARLDALSGFLSFIFAKTNNRLPGWEEVAKRVYVVAYTIRRDIIDGMTEGEIGALFNTSRQTVSARVRKLNEKTGVRSPLQKSQRAVSVYREGTQGRWDEDKEE